MRQTIRFCNQCASPVHMGYPDDGDTRIRALCPKCGHIQYENPYIVVGTIPVVDDKVLLCRRNIKPQKDFWTLPAGFMELNETLSAAAIRETQEEAGAEIELQELFSIFNTGIHGFVHFFYRAKVLNDTFHFGHETSQVALFTEEEIPWLELAFSSVSQTLKQFFLDRRNGHFKQHELNLE